MIDEVIKYFMEQSFPHPWIEIYQSTTGKRSVGDNRIAYKMNEDRTLSFYDVNTQKNTRANLGVEKEDDNTPINLYLRIGQHFHKESEATIHEIIEKYLTEDSRGGGGIEIQQSSGRVNAGWGEIIYKINDDGTLVYACSNVDSSG